MKPIKPNAASDLVINCPGVHVEGVGSHDHQPHLAQPIRPLSSPRSRSDGESMLGIPIRTIVPLEGYPGKTSAISTI